MRLKKYIDPLRCWHLFSGVIGIYFSYLVTGVIHEAMLKGEYVNDSTQAKEKFTSASAFLFIPCCITWLIGEALNKKMITKEERVDIPWKKAALCAVTVIISTLTYTYAIYLTTYPLVMMFKSCNILSVILVGVLCSRVTDKKLKLGVKKIVIGVLITFGIILFKVTEPTTDKDAEGKKKTELYGIGLLIISLLADGFLPDFQAEIKSVYKPQPMQMMASINKWVTIISIMYSFLVKQFHQIFVFLYYHKLFLRDILIMGVLSTLGQIFVYRMIKQFKQHFVPFVITTRKIFTVGLSIVWFNHPTNKYQVCGIIIVFGIVSYEFISELIDQRSKERDNSSNSLDSSKAGFSSMNGSVPIPETIQQEVQRLIDSQSMSEKNVVEGQIISLNQEKKVYEDRNNYADDKASTYLLEQN